MQEKYKSCLEELIQFKSKEKITMEITEIDKLSTGQNVSMEEIVNSIKEETKPITLWGLSNSYDDISISDEDDDAKSISSHGIVDNTINDRMTNLRKESKKCRCIG